MPQIRNPKSPLCLLDENKEVYTGTRDSVSDMGYEPCGHCNP